MGIYNKQNRTTNIYVGQIPVIAVYVGSEKVWPDIVAILSCYAAGYWQDEYPWTEDTPWTD